MTSLQQTLSNSEIQYTQKSWRPWIVVFSAALFFFYEFIQLNMSSSLEPELLSDFGLTAAQLGNLSAAYFYGNLLFIFPAGILLDKVSTRRMLLIAMVLCAGGTLAFSLTHSVLLAGVFRFATGIGGAFCMLSCIRLASRWFPPHRMALITGLVVTFAMFGGMMSQGPLTELILKYGWRDALMMDAALGVVFLVFILSFVQDYPPGYQMDETNEELSLQSFWQTLRRSLLSAQNWLAGIYTCLLNAPIFLLGAIWGTAYLTQVHNLPREQAAWINSMLFLGTIVGSPIVGWLSDRIRQRRLPMIAGAIVSLAVSLVLLYTPILTPTDLLILFFILGFTTSTQVLSYPIVAEQNPKALTATSVSVISFCCVASGAVFQPLFGWLMDLHWDGSMTGQVPLYAGADYHLGLLIIPIGFAVGLIAALLIRETNAKAVD